MELLCGLGWKVEENLMAVGGEGWHQVQFVERNGIQFAFELERSPWNYAK